MALRLIRQERPALLFQQMSTEFLFVFGAVGGGGGGAASGNCSAGGGGGGGYAEGWLAVVPGQVLTIVVGQPGAAGGPGNSGTAGTSTSIGTLSATGGSGGVGAAA